jgi:hypothetical protein
MAEKQPLIVVEVTKDGSDMTDEELRVLAKETYDAMRKNLKRLEQSPPKDRGAGPEADGESVTGRG